MAKTYKFNYVEYTVSESLQPGTFDVVGEDGFKALTRVDGETVRLVCEGGDTAYVTKPFKKNGFTTAEEQAAAGVAAHRIRHGV